MSESERSRADAFIGLPRHVHKASRHIVAFSRGDRGRPERRTPRPTMNPHVVSMAAADLYSAFKETSLSPPAQSAGGYAGLCEKTWTRSTANHRKPQTSANLRKPPIWRFAEVSRGFRAEVFGGFRRFAEVCGGFRRFPEVSRGLRKEVCRGLRRCFEVCGGLHRFER